MAASKELITKIVLRGQVDGSIAKAFSAVSKNADTSLNKLAGYGQKLTTIFKTAAVGIATAGVAAAKAAIDYESAFAGVMKTVNETDTTSYEELSAGIRQLAKETPTAATEIAAVAEAAGQLGIKADDILTFSKTMIDLGETTNLTSEEAATAIAKMFNITGTSMGQVDKFGSTLVALGNNAATTESDILNMASRIASSATQIGMSEQELLALATSLSSVGLEAEGGGTAISTVMSQIDKAVALNSESLTTWAETAGMSVSDFSTLWEKDAYGAIQKVVKGMGDTKAEGGNLNILLEELGIKGIRTSDTMKRLSSASQLMSDMTALANESWAENTALTKEAQTRYNTLASKIQIAKNKLTDMGITIGNKLMPVIDKLLKKMDEIDMDAVADKIANGVQWVIDNFDKVKVGLVVLASAFAAFKIGGFINTIGGAVKELKSLAGALGITEKIAAAGGGLKGTFSLIGTSASGAFSKVGTALAGLGPYGWAAIAIIAVLTVAFTALWKTSESFRNKMTAIWVGLKAKFTAFTDGIVERINLLGFNFKSIGEVLSTVFSAIGAVLSRFFSAYFIAWFETLSDGIGNVLNIITGVVDVIVGIFTGDWARVWDGAKAIVVNAIQTMLVPFKFLGRFITNLFGADTLAAIGNWFVQLPGKVWTWLQGVFTKIVTWKNNLVAKAKETGSSFVSAVVNFFKQLPYKIGYFIGFCIGKVIQFGQRLWTFATTDIPKFISAMIKWFAQLPGRIWTWLVNAAQKVTAWGAKIISIGRQKVSQFLSATVNFFKQLPGKIWTWLVNAAQKVVSWGTQLVAKGRKAATDLLNAIVNKVKEIPGKLLSIGRNIVEGLWNGISNAKDWLIGKIKSFASGITDGFKSALGIHSPSVVMEKLFKWVPIGAGNGIINNAKYAINAVKSMGGKITAAASKISPSFGGVSAKLPKFGTGGTVTSPQVAIVGDKDETIVPHGNTARNRSLLAEAARGVGATSGASTILNFTFAPVISGGNAEENRKMIQDEEAEFERKMDAWLAKNRRLAF